MILEEKKYCHKLSVVFLLLCVLAVAPGTFVGGLWVYPGVAGALIIFGGLWIVDKHPTWPQAQLTLFVSVALAVMALENFQSDWPHTSWKEWLKLLTIFVPLIFLLNSRLPRQVLHPDFFPLVLLAAFAGALTLSTELAMGGPLLHLVKGPNAQLTEYNRGLSFLVIFAFPLIAGLLYGPSKLKPSRRWLFVILFILLLLVPAGLTESRAAKLAFVMGLIVTVSALIAPNLIRYILAILLVLCIGWPFVAQMLFLMHHDWIAHLPPSWIARMEIWDYMSYRIEERPYLGWGLGTAHLLPFMEPHGAQYMLTSQPAAHPHNMMTELWVELGLPGLALGVGFGLFVLQKIKRLHAQLVSYALGTWTASLCLSLVAYDFWTDSLFATLGLSAFVFVMLNKDLAGEPAAAIKV